MRFSPWFCLFLARAVLLASGHTLRGELGERRTLDIPGPPLVDLTKYNLQINTASNKISALKVRSMYAAYGAQAGAAKAATAKLHAEETYVETMNVMPELKAVKRLAISQAAQANGASKETTGYRKTVENQANDVMTESKLLAVQEVKSLLKDKFEELSEWRHKALANPWQLGEVAAAKAAAPYFRTMGTLSGSVAVYGLEAGAMKSQAAADAANAKSLAGGVDAKIEAGDKIAAEQDREMAKAMEIQSQQLAAGASTLEGQFGSMQNVMPQYSAATAMAAWSAEGTANADALPPPPVDPNLAFTPAPP